MDGPSTRHDQPLAGALHIFAASLLLAFTAAAVKSVSADLPNAVIVFWRNFMALLLMTPLLTTARRRRDLVTRHLDRHLVRGLSGVAAMYCFFFTIAHLPLAEAVLLSFTAPLFIPLVARIWIGEPITPRIRLGVWAGFGGILIILKPGMGIFKPLALVGIVAGILVAVSQVSMRRMADTEPPHRIVFYFCLIASFSSAVPLIWEWQPLTVGQTGRLALIAILALASQLLLSRGYNLAPAGRIGALMYCNVAFSALFGWLWWNETVDALTLSGALLVVAAGWMTTSGSRPRPPVVGGLSDAPPPPRH